MLSEIAFLMAVLAAICVQSAAVQPRSVQAASYGRHLAAIEAPRFPDDTPTTTCSMPSDPKVTCEVVDCPPERSTCVLALCDGKCQPVCIGKTPACPDGKQPAMCSNACNFMCIPTKTCFVNPCNGCEPECRPLPPDPSEGRCANGKPPVNCFIDPCSPMFNRTCASTRTCVSEYCGGCNWKCLLTKACKNGKVRRPCLGTANRCIAAKFGNGATCVPNQCNDCAAVAVGPCRPGYYVDRDYAACAKCRRGFACAGGNRTTSTPTADPQPCNNGTYSDERGLAECKQCAKGTYTPAKPVSKPRTKCLPIP